MPGYQMGLEKTSMGSIMLSEIISDTRTWVLVYYIPGLIFLVTWSIRIRYCAWKRKTNFLDQVTPKITHKVGRLTSMQLLGEALIYASWVFLGLLIIPMMGMHKAIIEPRYP